MHIRLTRLFIIHPVQIVQLYNYKQFPISPNIRVASILILILTFHKLSSLLRLNKMIPGQIVCQNYQIVKKVGQGSFGYVYKIKHRTTHEFYALKTDEKSVTRTQIQAQVQVLREIAERSIKLKTGHKKEGFLGTCLEYHLSQQTSNKMIMPLYGQNIYNLFQKCNKRFDVGTIHQVSLAMLRDIKGLHQLGFIHRDVKPQNFVIGQTYEQKMDQNEAIYLIDFGLAKAYTHTIKGQQQHVSYEIGRKIRGTLMYMSINVLLGIEPSRRDDLQSLMYIVVLLIKGRLPWYNMKITKKDFDDLTVSKISIHPDQLFVGLPQELKQIYIYIRKLKFEQKPDYEKISIGLQSVLSCKKNSIQEEYSNKYRKYCWQSALEKYDFRLSSQQVRKRSNKAQNDQF